MKKLILIITLFLSISSNGKEVFASYRFNNFDDAKKSESFLKFDMESTKLGFITTSFEGLSKKFVVQFEVDESGSAKNGRVIFDAESLDTDNGSRDEKMHNKCFDFKNHPQLIVEAKGPLKIGAEQTIPAVINLRGKSYPIDLKLTLLKKNDGFLISGSAQMSIKKLQIPDPSIPIASVRDRIDVSFSAFAK